MLKLNKIAVTGGLSSGKTTVCRILQELGAYVVNADEIVRQLLSSEPTIQRQVLSLLGTIDRRKIANIVFSNSDLLNALEKILHPAVFDEIARRYTKALSEKRSGLFVAEIPLLYEAGKEKLFDAVISVVATQEKCKQRFQGTEKEFEKRLSHQLPPEDKAQKAHYIIENNGSLEELRKQLEKLYSELTKL